jgi:cob(I)alamin adenosyltransferase
MAKKMTIADLEALVATLAARLDGCHTWCTKAQAKIVALEAQEVKTKKQLWYLQKVAKGEFAIGSAKPTNGSSQEEAHDASQLALAENQPF